MTKDPEETLTIPFETPAARNDVKLRIARERKANTVILEELSSYGVPINYVTGMIVSHFEAMVELGIIHEDQWTAMQLIWEERFNEQLRQMLGSVRQQVEQMRIAQQAQASGIQTPNKGIVLPNGGFRKVQDHPQA